MLIYSMIYYYSNILLSAVYKCCTLLHNGLGTEEIYNSYPPCVLMEYTVGIGKTLTKQQHV